MIYNYKPLVLATLLHEYEEEISIAFTEGKQSIE